MWPKKRLIVEELCIFFVMIASGFVGQKSAIKPKYMLYSMLYHYKEDFKCRPSLKYAAERAPDN